MRPGASRVGVVDELAVQRDHHARRPQQLGLQHLMQVQRLLAMPLHQAVRAVPPVEAEQAGGVEQQHRLAQQAGGVQGLHAQRALHHLVAQALPAGQRRMAEEVVERVVDRQRGLRRSGPGG